MLRHCNYSFKELNNSLSRGQMFVNALRLLALRENRGVLE